jgi:hypothetical protein
MNIYFICIFMFITPLIQTGSGGQGERAKRHSFQGTNDRDLGIRPKKRSRKEPGKKRVYGRRIQRNSK